MTETVSIREVGLRDGLQLVETYLPTETKLSWCKEEAAAGFTEIEVTSFVPPSILPQFADAAVVLGGAQEIGGLLPSVLVPNLKGAIRALDAGAKKISFVLSASEAHNQSNVRCSTDASLTMFRELLEERKARELQDTVQIAGAIATSFGCSIQGHVPETRIIEIAAAMASAGADEVNLADTVGYANPRQVSRIFEQADTVVGPVPLAAHFHDTRGMGLANVVAAYDTGVRRFDASLGGLGGCPFAPGASGNIATEDCVYLLENLGVNTGIDLSALLRLRAKLTDWLSGEEMSGKLLLAGPAKTFAPNCPVVMTGTHT